MATATDWAWLAGIIEGEGYIHFEKRGHSVAIRVSMCDEDVVRRCQLLTGFGIVRADEPSGSGKRIAWRWTVGPADEVEAVFDKIEPYLGQRRGDRVKEARERLALVRRKGFCKRGHRIGGDNLQVNRQGQRRCRRCARDRNTGRRKR